MSLSSPRRPQRVNYDEIAHLYDEPLRDYDVDANLLGFLDERPVRRASGIRVLDTGCGTGKQLAADRRAFPDGLMVGLDLFHGMLRQAHRRCSTVAWAQGNSARLPLKDASFDYITNQFSYHHVPDKPRMIVEIGRVLSSGGRFVMTNLDPWSMPGWIVYTYFPAARQRDFEDCLPVEEFAALMTKAGFSNIQISRRHWREKEDLKRFFEYASQRYRTSQLMAISDSDFKMGIARLAEEIEKSGGAACVDSEICLVTIIGDKR
jgi:ubiquinone/menaquinone biosynthesis C-methylase UbiE